MSKFLRLMILGPPGSGKGTISKRIAEAFHLKHVSSGDTLRDHIAKSSPIGKQAREYIDTGQLVPDEMIVNLMLAELGTVNKYGWLLDGFPRTLSQAKLLSSQQTLDSVIYLNVPFETIISRVKERWIHLPSGRTYNLSYNPPKAPGRDDVTGEPLQQREDDKLETVTERLKNYQSQTTPLLKYYDSLEILRTFTGTESDRIWPEVKRHISETDQFV